MHASLKENYVDSEWCWWCTEPKKCWGKYDTCGYSSHITCFKFASVWQVLFLCVQMNLYMYLNLEVMHKLCLSILTSEDQGKEAMSSIIHYLRRFEFGSLNFLLLHPIFGAWCIILDSGYQNDYVTWKSLNWYYTERTNVVRLICKVESNLFMVFWCYFITSTYKIIW